MDPNETVRELRQLAAKHFTHGLTPAETDRMVDLWGALDPWLANGGVLPETWAA